MGGRPFDHRPCREPVRDGPDEDADSARKGGTGNGRNGKNHHVDDGQADRARPRQRAVPRGKRLTVRERAALVKEAFPEIEIEPLHPERDHFKTLRSVLGDLTHRDADGKPAARVDRSNGRARPHGEGLWTRCDRHEGEGPDRRYSVGLPDGGPKVYDGDGVREAGRSPASAEDEGGQAFGAAALELVALHDADLFDRTGGTAAPRVSGKPTGRLRRPAGATRR